VEPVDCRPARGDPVFGPGSPSKDRWVTLVRFGASIGVVLLVFITPGFTASELAVVFVGGLVALVICTAIIGV